MPGSNFADLQLGQIPQRENGPAKIFIRQHPQEIGLVLAGIRSSSQAETTVLFGYAGIMTGGDKIAVVCIRRLKQFAPFDV